MPVRLLIDNVNKTSDLKFRVGVGPVGITLGISSLVFWVRSPKECTYNRNQSEVCALWP